MARSKNMTDEDRALWEWITRDVKPLSKTALAAKKAETAPIMKRTDRMPEPSVSHKKHDVQAKIDRRTTRKLAKGQLQIGAKLDLHGKTQDSAHKSLVNFIHSARKRGVRVALVVTGKGAGGEGVLRRNVPLWLESPSIAPHILNYAEARPEHGGTGALYILIKKLT